MSYRVEVCPPGGRWRLLPSNRPHTAASALAAFDWEVLRAVRGVRVLRWERGAWRMVTAVWPRQVAA